MLPTSKIATYLFCVFQGVIAQAGLRALEKTTTHPVTTNTTKFPVEELSQAMLRIKSLRETFPSYERRVNLYINNVRREYLTVNSNFTQFFEILENYMIKLPNGTNQVRKKFRTECWCAGRMQNPCPDRCLDSCYPISHGRHYDNCSEINIFGKDEYACECFKGSSFKCSQGNLSNCFFERIESDERPCMEFVVDRKNIKRSFNFVMDFLFENLKIHIRKLIYDLSSLKKDIISTDVLSNFTTQQCTEDTECQPEIYQRALRQFRLYMAAKQKITEDMFNLHDEARKISKAVYDTQEKTIAQVNSSIKQYSCCLKALNFDIEGVDCPPEPIDSSTSTLSPQPQTCDPDKLPEKDSVDLCGCYKHCWACNNDEFIALPFRCDGKPDCIDGEDEHECSG